MKKILITTTLAMLAAGFAPAFVQASPSSAGMAKHKMMRSHAMKKHRMHAGHGGRMPASKNF